ncbi:hypothetical protein SEMRO_3904_G351800.1 [Seminavis robusta]|uniref:Uncharacterized protein n=1 Tax=Seminavis robusta TaxID=568900 RepID=A0A9N8HYC2_9STRA|nr:hypothetical protein SEMRO_3904_G351800.1 [Seminavis robusta]|eukprot:Sro3904_g351800.1 n/a (260) ;mRNA; r:18-797
MAIKSWLPYVQLRPPTYQELSDSSIPHVDLTIPHAWDPSRLDSVPEDDWFLQQDKTLYDDVVRIPLFRRPSMNVRLHDYLCIHSDCQNQSIVRRGIMESMAHIISDEIDLPPLIERASHGYDSDSSDDSDGYASDPDTTWQCHVQNRAQRRRPRYPPPTPWQPLCHQVLRRIVQDQLQHKLSKRLRMYQTFGATNHFALRTTVPSTTPVLSSHPSPRRSRLRAPPKSGGSSQELPMRLSSKLSMLPPSMEPRAPLREGH